MISLTRNTASLAAQRRLAESSAGLEKTLMRLSTGARISCASDDAAGLAIADALRADARVYNRALLNVNDGVSLLNIVSGALQQLSAITTRQVELATQSANGVYSSKQRQAINKEANALSDEFNRILQSTMFNGIKPLAGSSGESIQLQVGKEGGDVLALTIGTQLARTVGSGTFGAPVGYNNGTATNGVTLADMNNDGTLDVIFAPQTTTGIVRLGLGDGTLGAAQAFTTTAAVSPSTCVGIRAADFDHDGYLDVAVNVSGSVNVLLGRGDGTLAAATAYATGAGSRDVLAADFNGDGNIDLATSDQIDNRLSVLLGNGDGTFKARASISVTGIYGLAGGDFTGDGLLDIASTSSANYITILHGTGDGTFENRTAFSTTNRPTGIAAFDLDGDRRLDFATADYNGGSGNAVSLFLNNGDGSFRRTTYAAATHPYSVASEDMNGDGVPDLVVGENVTGQVSLFAGGRDGTLNKIYTGAIPNQGYAVAVGDLNHDGAPDAVVANNNATPRVLIAQTATALAMPRLDLLTVDGARSALDFLGTVFDDIAAEQGAAGAAYMRLDVAASNLNSMILNHQTAESRIRDVDVAEEGAGLVRRTIMQQAAAGVLAQANKAQPEIVLGLLS